MVRVTPREQIELADAVEALFDDPDITVSTQCCEENFELFTAIVIETAGWRTVRIRINEMYRDVRLGMSTLTEMARAIVMIYDVAYRYKAEGGFVTVGN